MEHIRLSSLQGVADRAVDFLNSFSAFRQLVGYVEHSLATDPWRLFLEFVVLVILLNYLFRKGSKPKQGGAKPLTTKVRRIMRGSAVGSPRAAMLGVCRRRTRLLASGIRSRLCLRRPPRSSASTRTWSCSRGARRDMGIWSGIHICALCVHIYYWDLVNVIFAVCVYVLCVWAAFYV